MADLLRSCFPGPDFLPAVQVNNTAKPDPAFLTALAFWEPRLASVFTDPTLSKTFTNQRVVWDPIRGHKRP